MRRDTCDPGTNPNPIPNPNPNLTLTPTTTLTLTPTQPGGAPGSLLSNPRSHELVPRSLELNPRSRELKPRSLELNPRFMDGAAQPSASPPARVSASVLVAPAAARTAAHAAPHAAARRRGVITAEDVASATCYQARVRVIGLRSGWGKVSATFTLFLASTCSHTVTLSLT